MSCLPCTVPTRSTVALLIREAAVFLLAGGALFSLIWAVAIYVSKRGYLEQTNLALMILLAGVWQAAGAYGFSGLSRTHPMWIGWQNPALFLLGPLIYRYFRSALLKKTIGWKGLSLHILPAVVCAVVLIPFWIAPDAEKLAIMERAARERDGYALVIVLCNAGPKISILAYLTFVAVRFLRSVIPGPVTAARQILFAKLASIYAALAVGTVGYAVQNTELIHVSAALLPLIVFVSFILSEAVPGTFAELGRRVRTYERTRLGSVSVDDIRTELVRLMEEEKAYLDEDLTLQRLADDLGLTPHQLSEFLNRHMQKSFSDYVNSYRVQEAASLLVAEPDRTTLSVAHASGFNSKSAFYRAFRKAHGRDPSEFRREKNGPAPVIIRET